MEKLLFGEVELELALSRTWLGRGFIDTLCLVLNRAIRERRSANAYARALLELAGYRCFRADLDYLPADVARCAAGLCRHVNGALFVTDLGRVAAVAANLVSVLERVISARYSFVSGTHVVGLDYFDGAFARRQGNLYVLEAPPERRAQQFAFYESHRAESQWLKEQARIASTCAGECVARAAVETGR